MSPRAACRLEQLGFGEVYDYVGGKTDWLAYDLPYEGDTVLASSVLHRDVPTAGRDERLADLRDRRLDQAPAGLLPVLAGSVVNGVVTADQAETSDTALTVDDVMRVGATTVRPAEDVDELLHRMEHAGVPAIVVTRPNGTLVGVLDAHEMTRDNDHHDNDRAEGGDRQDYVPDAEVSSETTPPDPNDAEAGEFSGTGVPGAASDSAESRAPGDAGVDNPRETMESGGGSRVRRALRAVAGRVTGRLTGR